MRERFCALLVRAFHGDRSARLVPGWRPLAVAGIVLAFHAATSLLTPGSGASVAFAIVPLAVAAVFLAPIPAALVIGATALVVAAAEFGLAADPGLSNVEITEIVAFVAVAAALRVVIVRVTRERLAVATLVDQLAAARAAAETAQVRIESATDASDRGVRQLEVVQRAAARMTGRPSVRAVAEAIIEETRAIVDYHDCRVYLLEGDELLPVTAAGRSSGYETIRPEQLRVRVGQGFTGWVALHGTPLLIPDANADPRGVSIPGTDNFDESLVVVPMRYEDRVVGVILVARRGVAQFDESHKRLLMIIADHAATALESTRQLMRSQELATELQRIVELSTALSQSLDSRRVADLIAQHMAGALGADEVAISHYDRGGDRLLTWGYWPEQPGDEIDGPHALEDYPATRQVLDNRTILEVDATNPAADRAECALLKREGFRCLVMVPLVAKGESIGLVELLSRKQLTLDERRRDLARAMANESAMALANAQLYETARGLADRDPLTGFFNHRYLQERLNEEILRAQRTREPLSILMIDLDDFKLVNDTLGHLFGDEVLVWVAEQIRAALRTSDVAARYGGDEFAVILPATTATGARAVGDRILTGLNQAAFRAPHRGPVPVGASIGISAFPLDGATARDLLSTADARLYRVKRTGGGAVESRVGRRHGARPSPRPLQVITSANVSEGG